jgi:hypothetical protein
MSHPNDVARLREIKRLLDRIQQLPHIAGIAGNGIGSSNGLMHGFQGGRPGRGPGRGLGVGPPHPSEEMDLEPDLGEPGDEPGGPPRLDPARPAPLDLSQWERASEPIADSRALVPVQQSVGIGMSPWVFIAATAVNTIVAAVLAVVITLGVARRDQAPVETDKVVAATVKPVVEPHSESPPPSPVELLPVGSPTEPLRLEALKPAHLPFQVRPDEAVDDSYILLLTGLPGNAALIGASRMGTDSWMLSPGALQRLELIVPEWSPTVYEVGVELRRTNGAVVAQSKLWLAIPPPALAPGAKLDESAIKELVRSGDALLSRGNVTAARAIYERAAAMGSAQAALALGTTYDPRRLWTLGVFGMVGDKERARQWYLRAEQLGHPEAKARMAALKEK